MPTIDIYYRDEKIESREFKKNFLITCYSQRVIEVFGDSILETDELPDAFTSAVQLSGRLFWRVDGDNSKAGSTIVMWIHLTGGKILSSPEGYQLHFVTPDWQLTLDGVQLPRKLYELVNLDGNHVSLQYEDYEFVCQFPKFK